MKSVFLLLTLCATSSTISTHKLEAKKYSDYKPMTDDALIKEVLQHTAFSDDHNHKGDNAFLTKVFRKWSELGLDGQGEFAGKRAFNKWTASWVAKDILKEWKGITGEEAEKYIDSD